jgi:hypothetical protein
MPTEDSEKYLRAAAECIELARAPQDERAHTRFVALALM